MSVNIYNETVKSKVFITKKIAGKAFDILKQEVLKQDDLSGWITISEVEQSKNFTELMMAMRWIPEVNNDGDVISLVHDGFNIAEEELVFKTIAPFVKNNSFVEFEREGSFSDLRVRFDFMDGLVTQSVWNKIYNENTGQDEFIFNDVLTEIL
ncbi:MAG: hypothetical protein WC656_01500 [Sulfurimonas sp.]